MALPEYTIVVPSRKRVHNMPTIRGLLPSAIICVDEREKETYQDVVPKKQLLLHPPMDGLYSVINWMIEKIKTPVFIEIDDDFRGVRCTTGSKRFVTNPEEILAILENAAQCCHDVGGGAFCFSRTVNTTTIRPNECPIVPVQSVCNAFGIMGTARHRPYKTNFLGRGDVDWTLQTLLEDRFVYADVRYYFDCGRVFSGRGGNVGLVTPQDFSQTSDKLQKKWGRYVSYKPPAFAKKRSVAAIRINVSRTNPTAQK